MIQTKTKRITLVAMMAALAYVVMFAGKMFLVGAFSFVPEVLMAHRIAESQETASAIADHRRYNEDLRMFEDIWGKKFARFLMWFYKRSYNSSKVS